MSAYLCWRRIPGLAAAVALMGSGAAAAVVNLSTSHDVAVPANITASASTQLSGLASLAQVRALAPANRYVYSFETWPEATANLGVKTYSFMFDQNADGTDDQRITLTYSGPYSPTLTKNTSSSASSPSTELGGLGDIGWGGGATHTFTFQKPVAACGFVYRSAAGMEFKADGWNAANYPVSYTLSDGTVVNLGAIGVTGAMIAASTNTFVGLIDDSGKGIISFTVRVKGSVSSGGQWCYMDDLMYVDLPEPVVAPIANLKSNHDFRNPDRISASASSQLSGLCSLASFRDLAGYNRHVYSFTTWPQSANNLGTSSYPFKFDLNGDGTEDQRVTITYSGAYSGSQFLDRKTNSNASSPTSELGGLGEIGYGNSATHTFAFAKPVSACGMVYRSAANFDLRNNGAYPVSYTLSDGTVVNLGSVGVAGATIAANTNTFVGVIDTSGKGISSLTTRVKGSVTSAGQFAYLDDLAFVMAGPPPGNWRLILNEDFNGTTLDMGKWSTGMRYVSVINGELQGYVPENVSVANGLCSIKVEKRTVSNTDMYGATSGTQNYASGAIQTYNKWTTMYGYVEARVRMPNAIGTWPAFWLLPDRGPGYGNLDQRVTVGNSHSGVPVPMGNELDIFEFMSAWRDANSLFTSHSGLFWNYSGGSTGTYALVNDGYGPAEYYYPNADTQFHTYGMYWGPGKLVFYIDGKVIWRYSHAANIATCPEYLILNCAVHTNIWKAGTATLSQIDVGLAAPKYMDIDYVRVWADAALPAPTEVILDNRSGSGVTAVGGWHMYMWSVSGYYGADYMHDNNSAKGTRTARFTPDLAQTGSGTYEVFVRWPASVNHAANVPIDITHANGSVTTTVNQQTNGGTWVSLGTYTFNEGAGGNVLIRTNGTTQTVVVDAVRFQKR